jgi:cytidylate kinase
VAGTEPDSGPSIVIAVDGPSGSGKSTVARAVAHRLGLRYLDTGAMYRAITWAVLQRGADTTDQAVVGRVADDIELEVGTDPDWPTINVDGVDVSTSIRDQRVTTAVSAVSAVPSVRAAMVGLQQRLIGAGGIVVEGRDIATVVAPSAAVKVFLTADQSARARRRAAEVDADHSRTEADLARRDSLDSTRAASPLTRSPDATLIDATDLTADEVVALVLDLAAANGAGARERPA